MPNLAYKKPNSKWTILGIGTPGSAKTPALASFAEAGDLKIYNFDGESRLDPIIDFFTRILKRPDLLSNIDYTNVGYDNFKDFMDEFEKLQDECRPQTVMLDSVTSASVTCIAWLIRQKGREKGAKIRLSGGETGIPIPDWGEFNGEAAFLTNVLEIGKNIPANFIVTAHPLNRTKVEGSGKLLKGSSYTSLVSAGVKGVDLIPNYFNEIWKFETDTEYSENGVRTIRQIRTNKESTDDLAKTTCGLPNTVDFTNKSLYQVIMSLMKQKEALAAQQT